MGVNIAHMLRGRGADLEDDELVRLDLSGSDVLAHRREVLVDVLNHVLCVLAGQDLLQYVPASRRKPLPQIDFS